MNILRATFLLTLFFIVSAFTGERGGFENTQKSFARVNSAFYHKQDVINERCRAVGLSEENFGNIFIRVFKHERTLEIWAQKPDGKYVLFNEYHVYSNAGKLGPKREQGDYQVPEGYYYITDFNPYSTYYLSLGINYPNESDSRLSTSQKKGGSIYIHGSVVSAGCLAMSDYYIEDIYVCCVKARNQGEMRIPVQIYPFKMSPENMAEFSNQPEFKAHTKFWNNLAIGYKLFENYCCPPMVSVASDGYYQFTDPTTAEVTK